MNCFEEELQASVNYALSKVPRLDAKVFKVKVGHTYCRCYLKAGPTVKESKVRNNIEYLARELKLEALPIVSTVYSEGCIVIDIPNAERDIVPLEDCLQSKEFQNYIENAAKKAGLPYTIGVDNNGTAVCGDLTEAPHLLIAGQSGSGKSVVLRCVLNSLLSAWHNLPNFCQFVLLDPKGVELVHYRDIETVIDYSNSVRDATVLLQRLVVEMDNRYDQFTALAETSRKEVYSVHDYNEYFKSIRCSEKIIPYIVVVIDELADILLENKESENAILRLVQKARAAGIHIVLSTQRPSNDIISGPIKANVPAKICCKVAMQVDGRVVFGDSDHGAHRLLGQGDMLFIDERFAEPIRLQGAYTDADFVRSYKRYISGEDKVVRFTLDKRSSTKIDDEILIPPFRFKGFEQEQLYG